MEREPVEKPDIIKADVELFRKHEKEIIEVERGLIENSSSEYLIDEEDELGFMYDALNKGGYAYLVMEDNKVTGFMVVGPLDDGSELPNSVVHNYPIQNCLQVKMMYIKNTGEGIGSSLVDHLLEEIDRDQWKHLFVRTWVEPVNEGAIRFYTEKAGFEIVPDSIVESTKTKLDQSGTFQIKRQYFSRKV